MKKSMQNTLEEEGVYLDFGRNNLTEINKIHVEQKEFHSAPSSPKSTRNELRRAPSTKSLDTEDTSNDVDSSKSSPSKSFSFPTLSQVGDGKEEESKDQLSVVVTK